MTSLIGITMLQEIPAGVMGPEPVTLDVRAYLAPYASGLVLVDTGMDASGAALDAALAAQGAAWSDVSHVVVTHAHPDHTGALGHVRRSAPTAVLMASPLDAVPGAEPLGDGDVVGALRVFATPGHTAGHLSYADEDAGSLLVGDCLGVVDGALMRAPRPFTADPETAESSLRRLLDLRGARMLLGHGPEIAQPWAALDALLDEGPAWG